MFVYMNYVRTQAVCVCMLLSICVSMNYVHTNAVCMHAFKYLHVHELCAYTCCVHACF